jgi:hypothetical protein
MLILRKIRYGRWNGEEINYEEACEDFALRPGKDDTGLSVYKVQDEDEARKLGTIFAATLRDKPDNCDYLLVSEEFFRNCSLIPRPNDSHHSFLSERHYEISDVSNEDLRNLVKELIEYADKKAVRIPRRELEQKVLSLLDEEPLLKERLSSRWLKALKLE